MNCRKILLLFFILFSVMSYGQNEKGIINIYTFYDSYVSINSLTDYELYIRQYSELLDRYMTPALKDKILKELTDEDSTGEDIVTNDCGIQPMSVCYLKVEHLTGNNYRVTYPIYDDEMQKYWQVGIDVTLDSDNKIASVEKNSYSHEIEKPK